MNNLIENLNLHKTEKNKDLVEEIIRCICEHDVDSIEKLALIEDKIFTINGKVLTNKERIKYCFFNIENTYYDYDGMLMEEIKQLKKLKESISKDISEEAKILNLIMIHMLTNRELIFIKEAYTNIIKGIL